MKKTAISLASIEALAILAGISVVVTPNYGSATLHAYMGMTMMADSDDEFDEEALALLDKTLDEIEDIPGFEVPYSGRYLLKVNRSFKKINEKTAVEIKFDVMECLKKDNDADPDTVPGTKFSSLYFLTGEEEAVKTSVGLLKQFAKPIGDNVGESNMKNIVKDHMVDLLIAATVLRRKDSKNPEIFRARVSNVEMQ